MIKTRFVSTHGDKLKALLNNPKLPKTDLEIVKKTINKYEDWIASIENISGSYEERLQKLVKYYNEYQFQIEFNLIFDSENDFLYRQKGQLKLDNTIIEEFLPYLVNSVFAKEFQGKNLVFGPTTCFSSVHFESSILSDEIDAGFNIHQKDQDFVIGKKIFIKTSQNPNFEHSTTAETHIAYVATECKTNLDKTMFQEASATALDLKKSVPNAKYYLLCEWLDMTPISTGTTAIDEIIILRKAKRLSSNIRSEFSTKEGRRKNEELYKKYLLENPFAVETFDRFLNHIKNLITNQSESKVLKEGYF